MELTWDRSLHDTPLYPLYSEHLFLGLFVKFLHLWQRMSFKFIVPWYNQIFLNLLFESKRNRSLRPTHGFRKYLISPGFLTALYTLSAGMVNLIAAFSLKLKIQIDCFFYSATGNPNWVTMFSFCSNIFTVRSIRITINLEHPEVSCFYLNIK